VQDELVTRDQTEFPTGLGWHDEATLDPQHDRGTHDAMVAG
jgi:hypothetical protein